ncbi:hypothetical protein LTR62_001794 [Meristemomyces frigidus]|uniref:Uncharacterized protein n=1 Tax=Meristemomyces frigidus TaxID=1508187 RepID=A0AAN7TS85_9PEZI|nr:hypothetical protein LTR62_001794 [Meristemomyces frigidus]
MELETDDVSVAPPRVEAVVTDDVDSEEVETMAVDDDTVDVEVCPPYDRLDEELLDPTYVARLEAPLEVAEKDLEREELDSVLLDVADPELAITLDELTTVDVLRLEELDNPVAEDVPIVDALDVEVGTLLAELETVGTADVALLDEPDDVATTTNEEDESVTPEVDELKELLDLELLAEVLATADDKYIVPSDGSVGPDEEVAVDVLPVDVLPIDILLVESVALDKVEVKVADTEEDSDTDFDVETLLLVKTELAGSERIVDVVTVVGRDEVAVVVVVSVIVDSMLVDPVNELLAGVEEVELELSGLLVDEELAVDGTVVLKLTEEDVDEEDVDEEDVDEEELEDVADDKEKLEKVEVDKDELSRVDVDKEELDEVEVDNEKLDRDAPAEAELVVP